MAGERQVVEGATRFLVPEESADHEAGPGARGEEPFFNPGMAVSRDLSVLVAHQAAATYTGGKAPRLLDGLAGIGARGLRWRVEVPLATEVVLCDRHAGAAALARRNVALNGVGDVTVVERELRALLHEEHFRLIDVDPFGSPAPFLDAASHSISATGILAVTATDAPALNGVHPRVAERRYGARPLPGPFSHELAVRILLGAVARAAAVHEKGVEPLLSYWEDHHYRIHVRVRPGAKRADASLAALGYAHHCTPCGARWVFPERERACVCRKPPAFAGPLWTGRLFDRAFLAWLADAAGKHVLAKPRRVRSMLATFREEADLPPLLYDLHELSRAGGTDVPPTEQVLATLRSQGFIAGRTHFNVHAVKTDAPMAALQRALRGTL